ncbi:putative mannan endo-1,6-alpha-mannosidase Ecym_4577 [Eremothecium cymbalariae DBVPG|uniref:Mannan endo-1,6-alpha-mannosidase n=1 Tax=Eremothecium cymbalariae (strain CBS 270.75 / DBVPG 7215 / KCTC 17166 / NRRL Y-17582) TaxID=931890 RepID=G8JS88_ERECY|nr:hypothetical protein Ecym_4577 [Eremothecium cymbalariae DBVPG\
MRSVWVILGVFLNLLGTDVSALELDVDDFSSMQSATSLISTGVLDYYTGLDPGNTIGMFSSPYYWWEAGAAWGALIDYWFYMENDTYNDIIKQALLYQVGKYEDYVPLNQSTTEGNDDQAFWGIAVMSAAEKGFPNPDPDQPQWLALAQAVFNTMAYRWDSSSCNGGLRWQIFTWNTGYDYKNSVSNGALFHLAARLARYTGNQSYADWAEKVYDWMASVQLINQTGDWTFVYDGAFIHDNCSRPSVLQWSYNHGLILGGCAYLTDFTGSDVWHNRTLRLLRSASIFFPNGVVTEVACQEAGTCNTDQRSFKAYFMRFLGLTAQLIPESREIAMKWIRDSAKGAALSCSGGRDGHTCGMNYSRGSYDESYGLGEQLAALETIQNLRCLEKGSPLTASEGGTSIGNPGAGGNRNLGTLSPLDISNADRAGAGIITALVGFSLISCIVWLVS